MLPAKYSGRRDEDRSHQREPAVAGGNPGQIREARHETAQGLEHAGDVGVDVPRLVRLSRRQGDRIDVLVDADQRESQIGLARISVRVSVDEASTDPVTEHRSRPGVDHGRPHHVAGQGKLRPATTNTKSLEMRHSTLMNVTRSIEACSRPTPRSADSSVRWRASSCMRWSGLTPMGPALARRKALPGFSQFPTRSWASPSRSLSLSISDEPSLAHVQRQERSGNDAEDSELHEELRVIAPGERIIERLIPAVEANLPVGRDRDHQEHRDPELEQRVAHGGFP